MPPKAKVSREDILSAGLDFLRQNGPEALNARALAAQLGCSTQPIFTHFPTMSSLREALGQEAYRLYDARIHREMSSGRYHPYKASGMGYIFFAREEPALFRLLFMRDRTGEPVADKLEGIDDILAILREKLGFSEQEAQDFHLQMWFYVHGIATMYATGYLALPQDQIERLLTQIYEGLRLYFQRQKEDDHGSH